MDAYSISYTTVSRRSSSKIYQDLRACQLSGQGISKKTYSVMEDPDTQRPSNTPPRIAIVGAGIAGLRCASVLLRNLTPQSSKPSSTTPPTPFITVFEARPRLGGRLTQTTIPGTEYVVDLGPNWIHGTDYNPVLDLAKELREDVHSFGEESKLWDENGNEVDEEEGKVVLEGMWGVIVQAFKESNFKFGKRTGTEDETDVQRHKGNDTGEEISESASLLDFFEKKVAEMWEDEPQGLRESRRRMCLQAAKMWGAFVGDGIERQSLKFFWLEECLDGENLFLASTYTRILQNISEHPQSSPYCDINLSTTVQKVTYSDFSSLPLPGHVGKVALQTCDSSGNVSTSSFDEVIITSPLGWLQNHHSNFFQPALPFHISNAIGKVGYGCLEKVFLTFQSAFWDTRGNNESEPHAFTQFLAPKYDPTNNPARHNIEAISLSRLPGESAHPTLLFYIFGDQAREISASLRNITASIQNSVGPEALDVEEAKRAWLASYFQPYISRLPGYDAGCMACSPSSALFTDWLADDWAGNGSYSNFQVASAANDTVATPAEPQRLDESIEIMRTGLPEHGVWFAGEHTAPFVALGTVTGAWWSGEAVGRRIAARYGVEAGNMNNVEHESGLLERRSEKVDDRDECNTIRGRGDSSIQVGNERQADRNTIGAANGSGGRRKSFKEVNIRGFADEGLERRGSKA